MGRRPKTQTTTSQQKLPKWAQKHFESYGQNIADAAAAGDLARIEGFTQDQLQAQQLGRDAAAQQAQTAGAAGSAYQDQLTGQGLFGASDLSGQKAALSAQAREALGLQTAGQQAGQAAAGTLGSARGRLAQSKAQESAGAQLAGQLAQLDQQDLAARRSASQGALGQTGALQQAQGAQARSLAEIGQQQQNLNQKKADSAYTALQRQGQLLGQAVHGQGSSSTTQPAAGGK